MKSKHSLLILLIIIFTVFSGCEKKEESKETGTLLDEKIEEIAEEDSIMEKLPQKKTEKPKIPEISDLKPQYTGKRIYEVQLLSLTDKYSVELQQELMAKKGIETYISEFQKGDELFYRLRLKGKYFKKQAEELGTIIKNDYWSITDYWVVKSD